MLSQALRLPRGLVRHWPSYTEGVERVIVDDTTGETLLVVDGDNLEIGVRQSGLRVDYLELLKYLKRKLNASHCTLFKSYNFYGNQHRDFQELKYWSDVSTAAGFYLKPWNCRPNAGVRMGYPDSWMKSYIRWYTRPAYSRLYERVVVVSSDNDFRDIIQEMHARKRTTVLVADRNYSSSDWREAAHKYVGLDPVLWFFFRGYQIPRRPSRRRPERRSREPGAPALVA